MKFALKIGSFLAKFFFNLKNGNSKIYLGISLELLWTVWGQFSFR